MYESYYQLRESPFNITADPDFFFAESCHAKALSHLLYGINQRKGIVLMTGEIGTGKTMLFRTLLTKLDKRTKTALILNPKFSAIQLLKCIVKDLGIQGSFSNKLALVNAINEYLIDESTHGNNVLIVIDEAQNLGVGELETIRLLSNLETEKQKLLQILLVGQPELNDLLKLPKLRQINQRISVRSTIMPLERHEIEAYINHRLCVASEDPKRVQVKFNINALDAIHDYSRGSPRMINILCDRALLAGFAFETNVINADIINDCAQEVFCT